MRLAALLQRKVGLQRMLYSAKWKSSNERQTVRQILLRSILAVLTLSLVCGSCAAQSKFGRWVHTSWGEKDGAPHGITSITKGPDGFLWLMTDDGVVRFDGSTFEPAPIARELGVWGRRPMLKRRNGDLWIFTLAGLRIVHADRSQTLVPARSLPFGTYSTLVEDQQRVVWATTNNGLFRYVEGHWEKGAQDFSFGAANPSTLFVGRDGTLWVATTTEVWSRSPGEKEFHSRFKGGQEIVQVFDDKEGRIWIGDLSTTVRPIVSSRADDPFLTSELHVGSEKALTTSNGEVWITTLGDGLRKVENTQLPFGKIDKTDKSFPKFMAADGLSDNYVQSIFQDDDGTLWVGTRRGLDRFRQSPVFTVAESALEQVHKMLLTTASDDSLWVSYGGTLLHVASTQSELPFNYLNLEYRPDKVFVPVDVSSWAGEPPSFCSAGSSGVMCLDGKIVTLSFPRDVPVGFDSGLAWLDPNRVPWLATREYGIFHRVNGEWTRMAYGGKQPLSNPTAVASASDGTEWLAFGNQLMKVSSSGVQSVHLASELSIASIWAIEDRRDHVWFGGDAGLVLLAGQRVIHLQADDPDTISEISGIQEASNGDLWISTRKGMLHITSEEWKHAAENDGRLHHFDMLGPDNGFPTAPINAETLSSKGWLWMMGTGGYGVLNINAPLPRTPAPKPVLRQVQADGETVPLSDRIEVGPHVTHLKFQFAAINLATSQKISYRYWLADVDKQWQYAGTGSEASYSNLSPGHYVLHVSAKTNGGVWSDDVRLVSVYLVPAWYQRPVTKIIAALGLVFAVFALFRWRVKRAEENIVDAINTRLSERLRISADLHDTFLQTVQGSKLIAEDALSRENDDGIRYAMGRVLSQLSQAVGEGRDALRALRAGHDVGDELVKTLTDSARESCDSAHVTMSLDVSGDVRRLHPVVQSEVVLLCREAVRNACQHSDGNRVSIVIRYSRDLFLTVSDDGQGMPAEVLEHGKEGHFGLETMRERAQRMGGKFKIATSPTGTTVSVELPGNIAYVVARGISRRWRWRRSEQG